MDNDITSNKTFKDIVEAGKELERINKNIIEVLKSDPVFGVLIKTDPSDNKDELDMNELNNLKNLKPDESSNKDLMFKLVSSKFEGDISDKKVVLLRGVKNQLEK